VQLEAEIPESVKRLGTRIANSEDYLANPTLCTSILPTFLAPHHDGAVLLAACHTSFLSLQIQAVS